MEDCPGRKMSWMFKVAGADVWGAEKIAKAEKKGKEQVN
jgi:hypothetical protein